MKMIVTIIPTNYVTNSLLFSFVLSQKPNFQQVGGLLTNNSFAFYFKSMQNSIGFYKSIFLHVIPTRITVPWLVPILVSKTFFKYKYLYG